MKGAMKLPALHARQSSSLRKVSHQVGSLGASIVGVRTRRLIGFAGQGERQVMRCLPLNTGVSNATKRPTDALAASEGLKQKRGATRVLRSLTEISTCRRVRSLRDGKWNCLCLRVKFYEGMKTQDLLNHGLRRWQDLFNPRQLLCLGMLMKAILQIEDKAVRELMAVTLSDITSANNMLGRYDFKKHHLNPGFALHAYWPRPCQ
jgi:hypothetical protein